MDDFNILNIILDINDMVMLTIYELSLYFRCYIECICLNILDVMLDVILNIMCDK